MEPATNTILITGAGGWLGTRLTRLLALRQLTLGTLSILPQPLRIRALLLPHEDASELDGLDVELVRGDLRNPADCAAFCESSKDGVLFHTAGVIHPRRVREFYEVNRDGGRNALSAAARAGVRRAIVVSSNSPIGVNPHNNHLFDESAPYRPYMNYGRSKMELERIVQDFQSKGTLDTVIVRPPWFYGPGQPPRQTLFFSMIRSGKMPIVGSGENRRSMAYIDNLCEGLVLAAFTQSASGQTYWIADANPYSMNEIVDTVEKLLESEFGLAVAHKRMRLPDIASEVAMIADSFLQGFGAYNQKIHVLSEMNKTIACSIVKAQKELGYAPAVSLEEGMRRSIADCMARGSVI